MVRTILRSARATEIPRSSTLLADYYLGVQVFESRLDMVLGGT
jgi:hypothetical protein